VGEVLGQRAPEIPNLYATVTTLVRDRYVDFLKRAQTSVKEFWEDEYRGGLCRILIHFNLQSEDTGISDIEKNKISTILSTVPPKLIEWDQSKIADLAQHRQLDSEIRRIYTEAIDILKRYLTREESTNVKPVSEERQDQMLKLIPQFFLVMEWIPRMDEKAARALLELDCNISNALSLAQLGSGHCDSLRREYDDLEKDIERLLPTLNWDRVRREKAQKASEKTKIQIRHVEQCFNQLKAKQGEIKGEICNLRENYQQYCVITISEMLSAKGSDS
jgi:hypothetical protein